MDKETKKKKPKKTDADLEHDDFWRRRMSRRRGLAVFPALLITVGFVALLDSLGVLPGAWGKLWPLFLVVPGLVLLFHALQQKQ